jgi:excisionase family DNA binding protein
MATLQIDDRTLYDIPEISAKLGVGIQTVRMYVRKGTLKGVKVGRRYWIDEKDLSKLFDTGTTKTG